MTELLCIVMEFLDANKEVVGEQSMDMLKSHFVYGLSVEKIADLEGITPDRAHQIIIASLERFRTAAMRYNYVDMQAELEELRPKAAQYDALIAEHQAKGPGEDRKEPRKLNTAESIERLDISDAVLNALLRAEIYTITELCLFSYTQLCKLRGIGPVKATRLRKELARIGRSLA